MTAYAYSLPHAEAQKELTPQIALLSTAKIECLVEDSSNIYHSPFAQYCAEDAEIWGQYMKLAKITDEQLAKLLNSELDPLLIFLSADAGLFSAILSAFLIEVRKGLQEDLQEITNNLLATLILAQNNPTIRTLPPGTSHFEPHVSTRWINGLWFTSLFFSLLSALGASLAKAWVTQYSSFPYGVHWADASSRHRRYLGVQRWHLKTFIHLLPMLIHASFFLFAAGLAILLLDDNVGVGILMIIMSAISLALYIVSIAHSVLCSDSPFRTPFSTFIRWVLKMDSDILPILPTVEAPATGCDSLKAQALSWLLVASADATVVESCVRAIAGLPATPDIQDRLFHNAVINVLTTGLCHHMHGNHSNSLSLRGYLYAIYHLVQTKRPLSHSKSSNISPLSSIVQSGGPLYQWDRLERGTQEVALCVKARILLFFNDPQRYGELFLTDVPILMNSFPSSHVIRLLQEVQILTGGDVTKPNIAPGPSTTCSILRELQSSEAKTRHRGHRSLLAACAKIDVTKPNHASSSFDAKTLWSGLVSDSARVRERTLLTLRQLLQDGEAKKIIVTKEAIQKVSERFTSPHETVRRGAVLAFTETVEEKIPWHSTAASEILEWMVDPDATVQDLAIEAVNKLAICGHPLLSSLIAPAGLDAIIEKLDDADSRVRGSVIRMVSKLIHINDIRPRFFTQKVVFSISRNFKDDTLYTRMAAAEAILKFAEHDNVVNLLATSHIEKALKGFLDVEWTIGPATEVFVGLAKNDDIRVWLLEAGLFRQIIGKMKDEDDNIRLSSINAISELAEHDDLQIILATTETIDSLLSALSSDDLEIKQAVMRAVIKLSAQKDSRQLLSEPGRIGQVFAMIGHYDSDVQASVIQTVDALAQHDDIQEMLTTAEVADKLIINLRTIGWFTWRRQQLALHVVSILAKHPVICKSFVASGVLEAVVAKLKDDDWDIQEPAIDALKIMADQHDDVSAFLKTSEVIKKHMDNLKDKDANGQVAATKVFVLLANNVGTRAIFINRENIDLVVEKCKDQCWGIRKIAIDALINLAKHDEVLPLLTTPARISKLLKRIEDSHSDVRKSAISALVQLADYDEVREYLAKPECLRTIMTTQRHADPCVRLSAIATITELAKHSDLRAIFLKSNGVVDAVIMKFKDDDWKVREAAINAVVLLAKHEDVRGLLRAPERSFAIMAKLWDARSDVRTSTIEAIVQLATHEDIRQTIATPETITAIVGQFKGGKAAVPSAALRGLTKLAKYDDLSKAIVNAKVISAIIEMLHIPKAITEKEYIDALTALMPIATVERISRLIEVEVKEDPAVGKIILEVLLGLSKKHVNQRNIVRDSRLWDKLVHLLDRRDTRDDAMDAIRKFAKIGDLRDALKRSDVVLKLVEMLKSGVDDIDGWCIGAEGLSALESF